ncbi:hypothetical protein FPOAC2_03138 [Fusarium poae]
MAPTLQQQHYLPTYQGSNIKASAKVFNTGICFARSATIKTTRSYHYFAVVILDSGTTFKLLCFPTYAIAPHQLNTLVLKTSTPPTGENRIASPTFHNNTFC